MARDFDGATGNLARSGVVSVATNNFTICAWIMVDVAQAGGIITNGFDGGSGAGWGDGSRGALQCDIID